MAANQSPPASDDSPQENQQDQSPPTYDDKLAGKLEDGGFSQEQQLSLQASLALLFGATTHTLEIRSSLRLLRSEIDIQKLVNDPAYKAQVERAIQLTNRYGRIVKKGDLTERVPKIERVIERTNACHSKLNATKSEFLLSDKYYLQQLQKAYGLDEKQLKAMADGAWARARENPSLSIKDALTMEAESFSLKQVTKQVENENKGKKLTREEKKAQIEKKLAEKQKAFETSLTTIDAKTGTVKSYADYENKRINAIINAQIEENKQILAVKPQSISTPAPQPSVSAPPPPPIPSAPISTSPRFNIPSFTLPSGLTQGLGNMFGGLGKGLFGIGGGLSKVGSGLAKLAGGALPKLASFALPPLGAVLTAVTAIDTLTGGLITKGAAILVGSVAAIVIVLPIIIGIGVFSHITGDKPMLLSSTNDRNLSWYEFDKQYLTAQNDTLALDSSAAPQNDKGITWQQFEKDNLTLQKQFLSLENLK